MSVITPPTLGVLGLMSMSVRLSAIISSELQVRLSPNFLCMLPIARAWWLSDTLHITTFIDDIIFAHKRKLPDITTRLRQ